MLEFDLDALGSVSISISKGVFKREDLQEREQEKGQAWVQIDESL